MEPQQQLQPIPLDKAMMQIERAVKGYVCNSEEQDYLRFCFSALVKYLNEIAKKEQETKKEPKKDA